MVEAGLRASVMESLIAVEDKVLQYAHCYLSKIPNGTQIVDGADKRAFKGPTRVKSSLSTLNAGRRHLRFWRHRYKSLLYPEGLEHLERVVSKLFA